MKPVQLLTLASLLSQGTLACIEHLLQARTPDPNATSIRQREPTPRTKTAINNVHVFDGTKLTPLQTIIIDGEHITTNTSNIETTVDGKGGSPNMWSTPTMNIARYAFSNPLLLQFIGHQIGGRAATRMYTRTSWPFTLLASRSWQVQMPLGLLMPTSPVPLGLTLHFELENLVEAGLMTVEALCAATELAAQHHRLTDRGKIAPGMRADLILLNSNPLANISNTRDIAKMWVGGIEYKDVANSTGVSNVPAHITGKGGASGPGSGSGSGGSGPNGISEAGAVASTSDFAHNRAMSDSKAAQPPDPEMANEKSSIEPEAQQNTSSYAQNKQSFSAFASLGLLDRFLAIWIFLAMAVGIILGNFAPSMSPALAKGTFVGEFFAILIRHINAWIAVGLLVMMYPILCKVQYESLHQLLTKRALWKQIGFSVVVNWIVAPFLMLGLSWAFLPDKSHLRIGLILVGLGRCIAMVLIWNALAGGNNDYCAILVAVNSILQMVLFAPLAIFFLRVISDENDIVSISYSVVATSVAAFLGIPLGAAILTRFSLRFIAGPAWYERVFIRFVSPWSLIGLLYTILVLFAEQGHQVVHQIVSVLRVAAPLVVYFTIVFFTTVGICRMLGFEYQFLVTQSFTAASNNFELAIAVAIATFGPDSDEALASTVGPLIEVPVLLGLVYALRWVAGRWGWK
ncbi:Arsenical-resistance protein Acr3 [Trichoderma ghanense]|uniref:Arsenical-resistance protein Acr3 n=1 Tax=Trichoderma ghanense TaxID=65468 RepID=A0ABY2GWC3_9HYPO